MQLPANGRIINIPDCHNIRIFPFRVLSRRQFNILVVTDHSIVYNTRRIGHKFQSLALSNPCDLSFNFDFSLLIATSSLHLWQLRSQFVFRRYCTAVCRLL
ncbi:MAG TPA: hypothetical protein DIW81_30325 [Planctomycetaceae bacterium]|nr:hypothetical protein [Rubinisphaera sp.]HCS55835.1 hypothetical protein [Planctomycetaceae bacterium]